MRAIAVIAVMFGALLGVVGLSGDASAHRDGCHGAHSCPSDANPPSYRCGDEGNECRFANDPSDPGTPQLGPPNEEDCTDHPEYYTEAACAEFITADEEPEPEPAPVDEGKTPSEDTPAATTQRNDLPTTGLPVWLYGLIGLNVLQVGWGLLLVEDRFRRGPRPRDAHWEPHAD